MPFETPPVLDFNNPIFAIITLVLTYVLPRIVGFVSAKYAASIKKSLLLGALSVLSAALVWLADVAVANAWATLDWTAFVNVIVNAALTWVVANNVFDKFIKPSGQADADAANGVELLKEDPARVAAAEAAKYEASGAAIANRRAAAEAVAERVAKQVVAEEIAKVPVATVTTAKSPARGTSRSTAAKPAAKKAGEK